MILDSESEVKKKGDTDLWACLCKQDGSIRNVDQLILRKVGLPDCLLP